MRSASVDARAGVTLAEMLVVILIIGLTAGVTVLSVSALKSPPQSEIAHQVRHARTAAIHQGRALMVTIDTGPGDAAPAVIRFLPDGRALGPGVEPWTGEPVDRGNEAPP